MTWLSDLPACQEICIECGAGAGEISAFMTRRFSHVVALDFSPHHLQTLQPEINPVCATANALPLADKTVDLVVSMQALHHFDVKSSLFEAHRVLQKGGIFAAFCWGEMQLPTDMAQAYKNVFKAIHPYWEEVREWVLKGYEGLEFNGTKIEMPLAQMTRYLTIDELEQHIINWSAMQQACAHSAEIPDPVIPDRWLSSQFRFPVSWPLLGKVFRV